MQTLTKLPPSSIQVIDRQRLEYGDIQELADSIQRFGLLQPIVIDQNNRLLYGGRRLAAVTLLKWPEVTVLYRETMTEDECYEVELEENVQRKDMEWQERCLNVQKIHSLKVKRAALESTFWGQRETAAMLGFKSNCVVSYSLDVAEKLKLELTSGVKRYWLCTSLMDAYRLIIRDKADAANALLASRQQATIADPQTQVALEQFDIVESSPDLLAEERARYYSNPHNLPDTFDSYWAEKQQWASSTKLTVNLSNSLFQGDSIKFMHDNPGRFNHVITDIPYGIDMEMLNQQHPHGGMVDLDTVEELHDVEYNRQLISDFFPAAFATTKERGFVITWCDIMLWQFMYDCATKAGFAVQRWPIVWYKTNQCMNQCVAYNTTKDTEYAIVCRKPGSVLVQQPQTSVIASSRDELCSDVNHPFAKPFEIWKFLVEMATMENESILEPFAGRGSGVISMLRLNRIVTGVELDQAHYNALLENVRNLFYLKNNPNLQFK